MTNENTKLYFPRLTKVRPGEYQLDLVCCDHGTQYNYLESARRLEELEIDDADSWIKEKKQTKANKKYGCP